MFDSLFSPFKIGNVEIKNRIVMPGMGTSKANGGYPNDALTAWYVARAKGGTGLIMTGITAVEPRGKYYASQDSFYDDEGIPAYTKMVDAVHAAGAKFFLQLHHIGRETTQNLRPGEVVAVSKIPGGYTPGLNRELTTQEVWEIINSYGDAALRGKKCGFDGVEIQGGHGYLPAQFMSMHFNRRTDEFGGDIYHRAKFGIELIKNIKAKCGADFPVSLRFSGDELVSDGRRINESILLIQLMIKEAGLDAINITLGTFDVMEHLIAPSMQDIMFLAENIRKVKESVDIPVLGVGRINDPAVADYLVANGFMDGVCMARAHIADPEFANKAQAGQLDEITPCIACLTRCQSMPGAPRSPISVSCAANPMSGFETVHKLEPVKHPKKVVIVGAGPAGLYAAILAAQSGHHVSLLEKDEKLGGQALIACMPPHKQEIARLIKHYITMCKNTGVDIRTGVEADAAYVLSLEPDYVILATGSKPVMPPFRNDGIPMVKAVDLLKGDILCGSNVLVIGGGLVGLETAEYAAMQRRHAAVVEMQPKAGADVNPAVSLYILDELKKEEVPVYTNTKLKYLTADGAVCEGPDGEFTLTGFDQAAIAIGSKPYNPLQSELEDKVKTVVIGDAISVGKICNATDYAMYAVLDLNQEFM